MKLAPAPNPNACPISVALDVFGDKWSLLIIRDIVFKQKKLYGEFSKSAEKIATNILANRLGKLEAHGIITKDTDPTHGSRSIYAVTNKGIDLIPILLEMTAWSATHYPQENISDSIIDGAPEHLLSRIEHDRSNLIAEISNKLNTQALKSP